MVGFGYSVGDVFAIAGFVYDVTEAVKESAGSLAEYEGLVAALHCTERELLNLTLLDVDDKHKPALEDLLLRYEKCFMEFEGRIRNYDKSLGSAKRPSKWWKGFPKKIKWRKCAKSDILWFQSELNMHAQAIQSFIL